MGSKNGLRRGGGKQTPRLQAYKAERLRRLLQVIVGPRFVGEN